jgi:hypothetical protein
MEVDRTRDVVVADAQYLQTAKELDLAARDHRIDAQLAGDRGEVLLQHLRGQHAVSGFPSSVQQ